MLVTNENNINYQRIEKAIEYLQHNFQRQPELNEVAEEAHLSSFHFQRLFSEWAGISPKKFLQYLTVDFLKTKLKESKNLITAAENAGLSSQSRVYDLFTTLEAVTPQEYKLHGAGMPMDYGFHETPFGSCLIATTERGVSWLGFFNGDEAALIELEKMKAHWFNSVFYQHQEKTFFHVQQIFNKTNPSQNKLNVMVKGTKFKIKVWEALLKLPIGSVCTYQDIAEAIQNPKAIQAVGSAVGSNHIAYLIPCHRVIRKDGVLGEYRWSANRKKILIGMEMAQTS